MGHFVMLQLNCAAACIAQAGLNIHGETSVLVTLGFAKGAHPHMLLSATLQGC